MSTIKAIADKLRLLLEGPADESIEQITVQRSADLLSELEQFTGSETVHAVSTLHPGSYITEGVNYLCEKAGAYWLVDLILSRQIYHVDDHLQVWRIKVYTDFDGLYATIGFEDREAGRLYYTSAQITDPSIDGLELYAVRNEHKGVTILLPSEY